jgi:hypothetical protein
MKCPETRSSFGRQWESEDSRYLDDRRKYPVAGQVVLSKSESRGVVWMSWIS